MVRATEGYRGSQKRERYSYQLTGEKKNNTSFCFCLSQCLLPPFYISRFCMEPFIPLVYFIVMIFSCIKDLNTTKTPITMKFLGLSRFRYSWIWTCHHYT